MEDASGRKLIQLEPFAHQVGGHSSMLCLDGATVAKPLVCREQLFYETLPATLRSFVPSFHGALEVHVLQGEGGYVTHAAAPPPLYRPHLGMRTRRSRIRLHGSGDIEIEGESEGMVFEDEEQIADEDQPEDEEMQRMNRAARPSVGHALNPWVLRCHRESLSSVTPGTIQNFILLENLTARFKQPCVLDLKVGTRQYGDSASPAKVRSKMVKVATTTSGKLGLRLGGMQVYQVTTRRFLCRNKLFGRALTVDGFRTTLVQFLHNGWHIRLDVVRPLLERLEALEGILTRLGAARFYTCSLLCLYEGELKTPSTTPLSPSTPAPPFTPGPLSSMPHGFFTSSRFTFPNSPSTEGCSSVTNLVNKSVNSIANGIESLDAKMKTSIESRAKQSFSNDSPDWDSRVFQRNLSKTVNSERISCDYFPVQRNPDSPIQNGTVSQNYITPKYCRSSSVTSEEALLANKITSLTLEKSSVAQGNCVNDAPDHSSISVTDSNTLYSSKRKSAEDGNIKLDYFHHQKQYSSPSVAMHSAGTCDNSCKNSKLREISGSGLLQQAAKISNCVEKRVIRDENSKCAIVRSVSTDSVSYAKVALEEIPTKNNIDSKVSGGVKKNAVNKQRKSCLKRSRSLEPQISAHSLHNDPFAEDCVLSCYLSPLVDVRLIDFAHSTHKGLANPVTYAGPDQGFLFGLRNLIQLLQDIAYEATAAMERC